ncbi:phage protein Gp27 family protein [Methylosinus sp. Sm6]|uniref:phage protein Gp27 family protein n=1 Tax=Methylosinus sp. Sm6 TaxID=2866948 RepID=UPI001C9A1B53|nr:phage protein Gp27 family protein [Methylosinus sp. Sm6]MBY6243866.1 DUF3486 family protein [Methylosinus sp. Sm6]
MAGRGRLASLDLVPEEGQEDIRWAYAQLNERKRTAADILFELNDRLEAKGLGDYAISKSAFNRRSVRISRANDRMAMSRAMFEGIADHLTPDNIDKSNVALGEFIKTLISEIVSEQETMTSKEAMELSKAFQSVVAAQKTSSARRTQLEAELEEKQKKAADALGAVAREAGLSAERVAQIRRDVLGVRT